MTTNPTALVTGIAGQDGSYLVEQLHHLGIDVHGVVRPGPMNPSALPPAVFDGCHVHALDLVDDAAVGLLMDEVAPDQVFHLAGFSSVGRSWQDPVAATRVNAGATASLMHAAFQTQERVGRPITFVNASSSEIFGVMRDVVLTEATPIAPTSPYGATKAFGHQLGTMYRSRGLAVSNAILFNHESPRRGTAFVTGKIARGVAAIAAGRQPTLSLGDLSSRRDWGWAPDYVTAMRLMGSLEQGSDFVIATGISHSVRDFVDAAFRAAGIADWEPYVRIDEANLRPVDPVDAVGDAGKARAELGWTPTMAFDDIVSAMVHAHMEIMDLDSGAVTV